MEFNFQTLYRNLVESPSTSAYITAAYAETSLVKKALICKTYLNSQSYGCIFETHIIQTYDLKKPDDTISGDCIAFGKTIEIKTSLGGKDGSMNYVQLRPLHKLDFYIFISYDITQEPENLGKIFLFLIPSDDVKDLILKYPSYAHGTISKNGAITRENLIHEYALRPNPTKHNRYKDKKIWNDMMKYSYESLDAVMEKIQNS